MSKHPTYSRVPATPRASFQPVILPGHSRNDLYVTLEMGEFLQDRKTAQKNVEVLIQVRKDDGSCVLGSIAVGSGVPLRDEYRSHVLYHTNTPRW